MVTFFKTLLAVQWCPPSDLLFGWGSVGGSETGWVGVLAAEGASSSGDDTNLGSKTHKLPLIPPSSHTVCCVGLHILTLRESVSFPTHTSHPRGGEL